MKLFLLRHTEYTPDFSIAGNVDPGLSEDGKKHAEVLAEKLAGETYNYIFVSPKKRTLETVLPLIERLKNIEPMENNFLLEGDSLEETFGRAQSFLDFLKKDFQDATVLTCGHQISLSCLALLLRGEPLERFSDTEPFEYGEVRTFGVK